MPLPLVAPIFSLPGTLLRQSTRSIPPSGIPGPPFRPYLPTLCSSACYRDTWPGIQCAKVLACQPRPAFSEGEKRTLANWGVPSGTLLLLVYVGRIEKSLAFTSTYGRGLWRTHDGTWHLAKSGASGNGLFTQVPRRGCSPKLGLRRPVTPRRRPVPHTEARRQRRPPPRLDSPASRPRRPREPSPCTPQGRLAG